MIEPRIFSRPTTLLQARMVGSARLGRWLAIASLLFCGCVERALDLPLSSTNHGDLRGTDMLDASGDAATPPDLVDAAPSDLTGVVSTDDLPTTQIHFAIAIGVGNDHTCAINTDGTVWCWGANQFGQVGNGTMTKLETSPLAVAGLSAATSVVAGGSHSCAINSDGTVWCWGENDDGQLGNGTTDASAVPVAVHGLVDVVQLAAGFKHTCAINDGGAAFCWGMNASGQLGNGSGLDALEATPVKGLDKGVQSITAGEEHSCAITNSSVTCWGLNDAGQLGNGTTKSSKLPVTIAGLPKNGSQVAITAASAHTCTLDQTGTAWCWGSNVDQQLGYSFFTRSTKPMQMDFLGGAVVSIAASGNYSCVVMAGPADRQVKCWGGGSMPSPANLSEHVGGSLLPATNLAMVTTIAPGPYHACAAIEGGTIRCWGINLSGELGDGTTAEAFLPVDVVGF